MRRAVVFMAVVLAVGIVGVALGASEQKKSEAGKSATLEGTLVDSKCYSRSTMNKGNTHGPMEACATMCAKKGIPVALLTEKGDVYVILAPAPAFQDHMAQVARVTGTKVFDGKSIRPDKIEVKGEDGKWSELEMEKMM